MSAMFTTKYRKIGKHRKKCFVCGKLIQDGDEVEMIKIIKEKWYPVKGIMRFVSWKARHIGCVFEEIQKPIWEEN